MLLTVSVIAALLFTVLSLTVARLNRQCAKLEVERDAFRNEVATWTKAYGELDRLNDFRRDVLGKINALVTRRPPRRRWLAISKHVAAIALEGWEPNGWTTERRAKWLRALSRELGA
jgi:hypothetical protein